MLVSAEWAVDEAYGGEISARLLVEQLRTRGWDVRVYAGESESSQPGVEEGPLGAWPIFRQLRDFQPDVVHAYNMESVPATILAAKLARVPAVATANSYWATCLWADMTFPSGELCPGCSLSGLSRDYENRHPATVGRTVPTPIARSEVARRTAMLGAYDAVVALSAASRDRMKKGGLSAEVEVIPNMVDPRDLEAELPPLSDDPDILFVGQLSHVKGIRTLVDAMPAILDELPGARLRVAGKGPLREDLEDRVEELGVEDAVEFLGHVDPVRLRELYEDSRALAVPSVWIEPFGRVLLEGWGRGAPIVATDRGGPGEVVDDGETGLLCPVGDPQALADELVRVLEDDELASRLRSEGKRRLEAYRPAAVLDDYEDVYRELAAPGGS